MNREPRIQILTGHFGSGKTEIAINLAFRQKRQSPHVAIADLDVINPYFRSREVQADFDRLGIELIAPKGQLATADLPIVTGELHRVLHDPKYHVVIDVGGDKDGATALGQFSNEIRKQEHQMIFVVNGNRPYVSTVEGVAETIRQIEGVSRMQVSALINNTHLGRETQVADIENGIAFAEQVSEQLGIPLLFSTVSDHLADELKALSFDHRLMYMQRFMKLPWESV